MAQAAALWQRLAAPHVASFNHFVEEGLDAAVADLRGSFVLISNPEAPGKSLRLGFEAVSLERPRKSASDGEDSSLWPHECRERGSTYAGMLTSRIVAIEVDEAGDTRQLSIPKRLGNVPIMLRSRRCHLESLSPQEMLAHKEEPGECGGTFIIHGMERVLRMLLVPRRNYVAAVDRKAFERRGQTFTSLATTVRCMRVDETAATVTVHYQSDGFLVVRIVVNNEEFFLPAVLVLKALKRCTDHEVFTQITRGHSDNTFVTDRVEVLLRRSLRAGTYTQEQCLAYLGSRMRSLLQLADKASDEDAGRHLLREHVFVHMKHASQKFNLLIFMIQKLYALVQGRIQPDNADSALFQEILLPGSTCCGVVKWVDEPVPSFPELLRTALYTLRTVIVRDLAKSTRPKLFDAAYLRHMIERAENAFDVGGRMEYFLSTGNLPVSGRRLDLMQTTGFSVMAERINFLRYVAHFRAVHRGSFFAEMKTTTVRKLLPDVWGFLCPVHTPDGSPCGLLNHLTLNCEVVTSAGPPDQLLPLLCGLGMDPRGAGDIPGPSCLDVLLDGRPVGVLQAACVNEFCSTLRDIKARGLRGVPQTLEICIVHAELGGLHAGVFLFSSRGRMMRPVWNRGTSCTELVGTFEQALLDISVRESECVASSTHVELLPTNVMSLTANLTPFSDLNQSPRNMYQCQMAKQTMGHSLYSLKYRLEGTIYRLYTPQVPLVRTRTHVEYGIDDYPLGTNAVVAVISYTGYDMEDALVLNKASVERGLAHGCVYKTLDIRLEPSGGGGRGGKGTIVDRFCNRVGGDGADIIVDSLDEDGLPVVGQRLLHDDPLWVTVNMLTGQHKVKRFSGTEMAYVEDVVLLGGPKGERIHARVKLRYPRNPSVGDKFSSRHGQKGVCSFLWPQEDMPFSAGGIVPDVIINPHAFPSRMTIGMLVESLAGKSAAVHGFFQDATPFPDPDEEMSVQDRLGRELLAGGFDFHGNETLYSGMQGVALEAQIFVGVVYYQRLRHMVSDKFQVRARAGPINQLTHQPVKGRRMQGGIRFGEMERDSLLAHGAPYLLHDRLFHCSDAHVERVCRSCGSILSVRELPVDDETDIGRDSGDIVVKCTACGVRAEGVAEIAIPYTLKYLAAELAAMNVRLELRLKSTVERH